MPLNAMNSAATSFGKYIGMPTRSDHIKAVLEKFLKRKQFFTEDRSTELLINCFYKELFIGLLKNASVLEVGQHAKNLVQNMAIGVQRHANERHLASTVVDSHCINEKVAVLIKLLSCPQVGDNVANNGIDMPIFLEKIETLKYQIAQEYIDQELAVEVTRGLIDVMSSAAGQDDDRLYRLRAFSVALDKIAADSTAYLSLEFTQAVVEMCEMLQRDWPVAATVKQKKVSSVASKRKSVEPTSINDRVGLYDTYEVSDTGKVVLASALLLQVACYAATWMNHSS